MEGGARARRVGGGGGGLVKVFERGGGFEGRGEGAGVVDGGQLGGPREGARHSWAMARGMVKMCRWVGCAKGELQ